MNSTKKKIYKREFLRYLCVWILFGIAIIFAIWINIPTLYIECNYSETICNAINNVVLSLSLSYIVGFFFFFLTEFLPTAKKKYKINTTITKCLNKLVKEYYGLFNFGPESDNYQRPEFTELSQSLFQEDVAKYCKDTSLSLSNGEGDFEAHLKPEVLLFLELNASSIRENLNIIQMFSHNLAFPIIYIVGRIKSCRVLSEIERRRGFRGRFDDERDLEIRFLLYKEMMREYYNLEEELTKVIDDCKNIFL